jgi:hypothetical protein
MSILCTSLRPGSNGQAFIDGAIDIEDFVRLYYSEAGADDVIQLYHGR